MLSPNLWRLGEATSLGFSLTVATIALVFIILAFEVAGGRLAFLAPPAALAALGSLALTGHALTAGPIYLTAPVLLAHVLVAAFWLGSLSPLWRAVGRRTPGEALELLRRFSTRAVFAIAILVAAGTILLGRLGALSDTAYGLRLASKLALVAALLLIAALNRLWLTPALAAGRPKTALRLWAGIGLEIAIGVAILAATSSLGETPPPRALVAQARAFVPAAAKGFSIVSFEAGDGALIEISPATAGRNAVSVHLFDGRGRPLEAQEVTLEVARVSAGIEPREEAMAALAPGSFRAEGVEMPFVGEWNLRLRVTVSDFQEIQFKTSIQLR